MSFFTYNGANIYYEEQGQGEKVLLLHGNTVSSKFFTPVIPMLAGKYHVITMDFLGCGNSDRIDNWSVDLWFQWANQAKALIEHLGYEKVNVIGTSGGAIAAINLALENPELVNAVVADSFEGIKANPEITDQIRMGREFAKQNKDFCMMLQMMHGDDWEKVLDADTEAVVGHALNVTDFFHKDLSQLKVRLMLTGSQEDEMFPEGHYERLFDEICSKTKMAQAHIFEHGGHPAMMSNMEQFLALWSDFL